MYGNFPYPVRIRWSRQPNLVPFYLYNRIFECPENIRNDGFPDVRWPSIIYKTVHWILAHFLVHESTRDHMEKTVRINRFTFSLMG